LGENCSQHQRTAQSREIRGEAGLVEEVISIVQFQNSHLEKNKLPIKVEMVTSGGGSTISSSLLIA
jgi:hypothetical protein